MLKTTYGFPLSRTLINQIDPDLNHPDEPAPPPFDPDQPFEFVDKGLLILGFRSRAQDRGLQAAFKIQSDRFDSLEHRFEKVEGQVKEVREEVKEFKRGFEARLDNSDARTHNMRAVSGWNSILPVGRTHQFEDGTWEFQKPKDLPDRVLGFWRLQKPKNHPTLISLLKFYRIQPREIQFEELDPDEDNDYISVESGVPTSSFEEIVEKNPIMQLEALAEHLGLDLVAIKNGMLTKKRVGELQAILAAQKRSGEEDIEEEAGPRKKVLVGRTPSQSSPQPTGYPLNGVIIDGQYIPSGLLPSRVSETKISSEQDQIMWDHRPLSQVTPPRRLWPGQPDFLPHRSKDSTEENPESPPPESPNPPPQPGSLSSRNKGSQEENPESPAPVSPDPRSREMSKGTSDIPTQRISTQDLPTQARVQKRLDPGKSTTSAPKKKR
jgi:hypothetical protein